jgi:hypothetical protein
LERLVARIGAERVRRVKMVLEPVAVSVGGELPATIDSTT